MRKSRIKAVAEKLYVEIYEEEFGGKDRGRFIIDREQLKRLLGVKRLHDSTLLKLTDACLEEKLVLIDMDDKIGFAEATYVEKWRKLPERLAKDHSLELDAEFDDDDDDDEEFEDADDDKEDDEE